MTAQDIVQRLIGSPRGVTPERLEKAKALATRSHVPWADVEAVIQAQARTVKASGRKKKSSSQ